MTTLAAVPHTELERVRETSRQRRGLEQTLQDAQENYSDHQKAICDLTSRLADAGDVTVEKELATARDRLRALGAIRDKAAADLAEFANEHPTADELARRESSLARQAELSEQARVKNAFVENVRRRLELLGEMKDLEAAAISLYADAKKRWPHHVSAPEGQLPIRAVAGIPQELLRFMSDGFWELNGKDFHGRFAAIKLRADRWLSQEASNLGLPPEVTKS